MKFHEFIKLQENDIFSMPMTEFGKSAKTFVTSQGSLYAHMPTGNTTRIKTSHFGHETSDVGLKQSSIKTIYVDPKHAQEIGWWQNSSASGKRVLIRSNKAMLVSNNPKTGQRGKDGEPFDIQFEPKIGLAPVELFYQTGIGEFKGTHPGNEIVKFVNAADSHKEFINGKKNQT